MQGRIKSIRPRVAPRIYLATGTPVSESPNNAFPVLKLLAPERVSGIARSRWDQHFVIRSGGQYGGGRAASYSNLEELKRTLEALSVRRLKADVRGMPTRTEDTRDCEATADQSDHYREILRGILAEIEGNPKWANTLDIACVKLLRARQVLNHPGILGLSGDSGKHRELDNIIEEVLSTPSAKIVLWTEWNAAVDLLAKRYAEYGVLTIDQRTSQDDLAKMDRTFDLDDNRVIISTPSKGGTGIDFMSRARTAVYLEKTYSLVNHRQSIDRIVRRVPDDSPSDTPDQRFVKRIKRSPATVIYLNVPGSVDGVVDFVLRKKLDLGDALLQSDEVLISSGRDDLIKMLRSSARI